ncbi:hypothetical protein BCR34DRAFT_633083 [Clohesyomyces aquaticus]|uniref:DUF7779 domain-containing protein n=1 Tax=Clohesyomyces aquaticus TaxID=1231657 RepID=A0A1Y1Z570_9PLEO|nr:hypothetical protein BCR34DRAFT_633083 [Clohesyomyces aquaticus]
MIVNNADDSSILFDPASRAYVGEAGSIGQAAEALSEFLPQSPNGSVLVTSRSREVAYRLTGRYADLVEVRPMDRADGLALLEKKLGPDATKDKAVELLQVVDYMPLAITQATAFIQQRAPRMTISRYLDEVRRSDHDRARLLTKDVRDSRRDGRASNLIIATWQISFEHIRKAMPTAARLLSLMSFFHRQGIPERLLCNRYQRDGGEESNFEDDIHALTNYSLVKMNADGNEFEMHRLVQFSTRKWLELYDELEEWKQRYITTIDEASPVGRYENWVACQRLLPHAEVVLSYRPKDSRWLKQWGSVLFKNAWYAAEKGQYRNAEEMDLRALEWRENVLGKEHPSTLTSVYCLAYLLHKRRRYKEASQLY